MHSRMIHRARQNLPSAQLISEMHAVYEKLAMTRRRRRIKLKIRFGVKFDVHARALVFKSRAVNPATQKKRERMLIFGV